jgi:hypothetical protein
MRVLRCLAVGVLLVGCYEGYAVQPAYTVSAAVSVAPPPPVDEALPPAPYPGAAWLAGSWEWRPLEQRYVWAGGRWGRPPGPGLVYRPPVWSRAGAFYRREPGRWVSGMTVDRFGRRVYYDSLGRPHYF